MVGGAAKALSLAETFAPRLLDRYMIRAMARQMRAGEKWGRGGRRADSLYRPGAREGLERGPYEGPVLEHSLYTALTLHPRLRWGIAAGVALGALGLGWSLSWARGRGARLRALGVEATAGIGGNLSGPAKSA
jgi:hypothetical protein